jgi:hypothetical protein
MDSIAKFVSFLGSFLCFIVDYVLSLVHLFDLSLQTSYSNDDVVYGAVHLFILFLPFAYLFFILL